MDDHDQLVLIAAYGDLDAARDDFHDLEARLKHGLELRSAALVTKSDTGEPQVIEAANKHGRAGTLVGAGVGVLFGLMFQPLVLAVLVGGLTGGLAASIAEHELRSGLQHEVGAALSNGTAVILALAYSNSSGQVQAALGRAGAVTSLPMSRATIESIDEAVAQEIAELATRRLRSDTTDTSS